MDPDIVREIRDNVRPALTALIRMAEEENLGELAWEDGDLSLRIRRDVTAPVVHPAAVADAEPVQATDLQDARLLPVTSTLVGIFRKGAGIGDAVSAGDVLAYVESMRLMNEVKAPEGGAVAAILVEDGHPVEYGQPLVVLDVVAEPV